MANQGFGPIVIGLTGGIGSGKSNVLATMVSLGAEGIDADQVAHDVMARGRPVHDAVIAAFGPDILTDDRQIDRVRLGRRVFRDAEALARLEAIVHPAVSEEIRARVGASSAPVVVIEAIKLLESGLSRRLCDQVWVTVCSEAEQVARLAASRGMPADETRRRMATQMPAAQMMAKADVVIDTNGTVAETGLHVLAAWAGLGMPMPQPEIRPGGLDDAAGIAAVLNAVVREGGSTVLDRTYTPAEERDYLARMPARSLLTVAFAGRVLAGFQVVEPYAAYTGTMDHVATLGSYLVAPVRDRGWGRAMSEATFSAARESGYSKLVIYVRADNRDAQGFYLSLGFEPCGRLAKQAFIEGRFVDIVILERLLGGE